MKNNNFSQHQTQALVAHEVGVTALPVDLNESASSASPSAEEISNIAYFAYVNQGSLPGRDIQHWLEAEASLLKARNLTRVHGFHNKT